MANAEANVGVHCKRCNNPIRIEHAAQIKQEFSVPCPKCGRRALYEIRDIKALNEKKLPSER